MVDHGRRGAGARRRRRRSGADRDARARGHPGRHRRGRTVGARVAGARGAPRSGGGPMTADTRTAPGPGCCWWTTRRCSGWASRWSWTPRTTWRWSGEAGDGAAALTQVRALHPDVVLMDVRMPGMNGIEATERIAAEHPATRVLVLTTFDLDEYAFAALRAGASGFLLKDARPAELVAAIRSVASGDAVVAPRVTRRMLELFAPHLPAAAARPERGRPPSGRAHPARAGGAARGGRRGCPTPRSRRLWCSPRRRSRPTSAASSPSSGCATASRP